MNTFDDGKSCVAYVNVDPVTGDQEFTLFTDDGHGNGDLIFTAPLAKVRALVEDMTGEECTSLPPLMVFKPGDLVEVRLTHNMHIPDCLAEWREAHVKEFTPQYNMPFYVVEWRDPKLRAIRARSTISGTMMRRAIYDEA
jgi:hypothetical protein